MDCPRTDKLDDLFCEFVARLVCVRPTLYVKTGALLSLVDDDPPKRDARSGTCRSCNGPMRTAERGRLICIDCRTHAAVHHGAPLIDTMYRSAHPRFVLTPDMETIVAHIGRQREVAAQERVVSKQLAYLSYMVYERWKAGQGDMNVYFTPDYVNSGGSYAQAITSSNLRYEDQDQEGPGGGAPAKGGRDARPRHLAVTVGGMGVKLVHVVQCEVMEWLYSLDAMIRKRFNISLATGQGDTSIPTAINHFATLIATRVALLEERVENPTRHVCSEAFEHIAEIQFLRCKHHAAELARADIRCMRDLAKLAQEQEVPEDRQRLAHFLRAPCPELLKALPTVAHDMRFGELSDALEQTCDLPSKLQEWAASVRVESLCLLLERAIDLTQTWKASCFIKCLRHDQRPLKEHLPTQGWVDDPAIANWSLVSSETHAHRRTGLDPPGLRIVLMSSALMQINGDGRFFRPGVMRCDLMSPTAHSHECLSTYAYNALTEQMWPYMTGEPWRYARASMTKWQGSHIEDDVRRAAALLGGFSVAEIAKRYGVRAQSPVELAAQAPRYGELMQRTMDMMVVKPATHYEQWFPVAVDLLLPILVQLRQSMGVANHIATDPTGDVLRLIARVRDWNPEDGQLRLTAGEVYRVPRAKQALLKLNGSALVECRRVRKQGYYWIFDPVELAKVLGNNPVRQSC